MEDILFKELQIGLEDIIKKFNKELDPLEKLGKKGYHLCTETNVITINRTSRISRKGHSKMILDIELHGNIIEATPQSSDWRLDKVKDYLQTFSNKYSGKGVILKYEAPIAPMPLPQNTYPYDSI
jgi:hypothetical protein